MPFPVAELLWQNGAEIPLAMPAFPLSRGAQAYIDVKRKHNAAVNVIGGSTDGAPSIASSSSLSGATEKLAKEREARLQKRVSAGGRLAKSPIPER